MLLRAYNRSLIAAGHPKTSLTAAAAVAGTTLTVVAVDSIEWADNDYIIVGEMGSPTAEIMQVAAAVSDGTSLTIDQSGSGGLRYSHSIGEPVYRIDFNRVVFYRGATNSTSSLTTLTTTEIHPDEEFTRYEDTANTTGYGFVRWNNQTTSAFSSYSDGVNYEAAGESSSFDPKTLWQMRKKVREFLDEWSENKLKNERIDNALNDKQRDIAHQRLWSFYETERSFSLVANQFAYDIPRTVQKVHAIRVDTQPIVPINKTVWDTLHFDTNVSTADTSHACVWNNQILLYPRPSTASSTTTLGADISSATATTITVASTTNFNRGDYYRFIVNSEVIYATASTSTTFTGCLRGREGTAATTHTSGDTVTERDIVYTGHEEPTDLRDTQDRTAIPEADVLAYGAAMDVAPLVGKKDLLSSYKT